MAKNEVAEIEAKFLIRQPEQFEQVLAALSELGYGVSERATETHVDRYFDTADWAILRAGWAYRCRERRGHQKLTLKSLGSKRGAVFVRDEIEQPLPDRPPPGNGILPPGPVQKRLAEIANGMRRRELFRVQSRRTVFAVTAPGNEATRLELD
ncbi:MAG: CYTH domain-containing protein, partial [Woeseiaceae bacterium]